MNIMIMVIIRVVSFAAMHYGIKDYTIIKGMMISNTYCMEGLD